MRRYGGEDGPAIRRRRMLRAGSIPLLGGLAGCMQPLLEGEGNAGDDEDGASGTTEPSADDEPADEEAETDRPVPVAFEPRWDLDGVDGVDIDRFGARILEVVDDAVYAVGSDHLLRIDPAEPRVDREIPLGDVLTGPSERTRKLVVDGEAIYLTTATSHVEPGEESEREDSANVYRFGSDNGVDWSHEIPPGAAWLDTIAVGDDGVYVASYVFDDDGESAFEVLDSDGTVRFSEYWSEQILFRDAVVHDGTVYVGNSQAFDPGSEELYETDERYGFDVVGSLTLVDDVIYAVSRRGVSAVDLDAEEVVFEGSIDDGTAAPTVTDEVVVASSQTGLYGFDRETGEERWHVRTTDRVDEPAAIVDGVAYALDDSNLAYGVDVDTGELVYDDEAPLAAASLLRAVPAHDLLVFAGREGVQAVEPVPEA